MSWLEKKKRLENYLSHNNYNFNNNWLDFKSWYTWGNINTNKKILKILIFIKKIGAKLSFGRCISLNWDNYYKLKAAYIANQKNNIFEVEEKNLKAKVG